jgi:hypothetical protein
MMLFLIPCLAVAKEGLPSAAMLFKAAERSIVVVHTYDSSGNEIASGSGVVIKSNTVVTNAHVIEGGFFFKISKGKKKWNASLKNRVQGVDIAVMQTSNTAIPVVKVGKSSILEVGNKVYTIGAPKGLEASLSDGIVSGFRSFNNKKWIQITAPISPGSSGGGLFNQSGELVGITTMKLVGGENLNFAIPVEYVFSSSPPDQRAKIKTEEVEASPEPARYSWADVGNAKRQGDWNRVEEALLQMLQTQNSDSLLWAELGRALDKLGQGERAVQAYKKAIQNVEHGSAGYVYRSIYTKELIDLLLKLRKYEESVEACRDLLTENQYDSQTLYNLGYSYYRLGDRNGYLRCLASLKNMDPQKGRSLADLASIP